MNTSEKVMPTYMTANPVLGGLVFSEVHSDSFEKLKKRLSLWTKLSLKLIGQISYDYEVKEKVHINLYKEWKVGQGHPRDKRFILLSKQNFIGEYSLFFLFGGQVWLAEHYITDPVECVISTYTGKIDEETLPGRLRTKDGFHILIDVDEESEFTS